MRRSLKSIIALIAGIAFIFSTSAIFAQQDKSKRPSPPAKATQKVGNVTITIDYSQPSVKGRTIGTDLEPKPGKVWRAGANEITVFQVDQNVKVEGKDLPKGKYGLYALMGDTDWTVIFSKKSEGWGTQYSEADDFLRITVPAEKPAASSEKLTYAIDATGKVSLMWGDKQFSFNVK
jgi:hypothetical protein